MSLDEEEKDHRDRQATCVCMYARPFEDACHRRAQKKKRMGPKERGATPLSRASRPYSDGYTGVNFVRFGTSNVFGRLTAIACPFLDVSRGAM